MFCNFLLEYQHMKIVISGLVFTALLLSACQQTIGMEPAVLSILDSHNDIGTAVNYGEAEYIESVTPSPVDIPDNVGTAIQYGEAEDIESVLAVYPPTWPEEMRIVVNGFLPDGCTEIYIINPVRYENKFTVKIYTKKDVGVVCTASLEPFEETIILDTGGLNSGNYSVDVYGISTNFALEISTDSNDTGG